MSRINFFTKLMIIVLFLSCCFYADNSYADKQKIKDVDLQRVDFMHNMAKHVDEYFKIKGHYPLADGKRPMPLVVYLSSSMLEVNYPVLYNNVTVFDYSVLVKELKSVLGDDLSLGEDDVDAYKNPARYIAKYYAAGNGYLITGNLSRAHRLSGHNVFHMPENHQFFNQSKIENFRFFRGFAHRYNIASISDRSQSTFSMKDHLRFKDNRFRSLKGSRKLRKAVLNQDYVRVLKMLEKGVEVNPVRESFNQNNAPLIAAVLQNDFKMTKILLEAGADPNARGGYEDPVLIYALMHEDINYELIELLLEYGADVNIPNFYGNSAFIGTCLLGDTKLIKLFLDHGARINQRFFSFDRQKQVDKYGLTSIEAAVKNNHIEAVKFLLKHGADIRHGTSSRSSSALEYAEELGRDEIVALLSSID